MTDLLRYGRRALVLALIAAILGAIALLETRGRGLEVRDLTLGASPATVRAPAGATGPLPLVVVAHGFAGSRQMMAPISRTLARAGHLVVSFDYHGHGRHDDPMSRDVQRIEGTTADLVDQLIAVTEDAQALPLAGGPLVILGHSMATDILIRAAPALGAGTLVAISMYSDAITPQFPERLLMISGAGEPGLREVAVERLRMVDPAAGEGDTAVAGDVERRAVVAPRVEHAGVLWSPVTQAETLAWLAPVTGGDAGTAPERSGPVIALLLVALVALFPFLATRLPRRGETRARLRWPMALLIAVAPLPPALAATLLWQPVVIGFAGIGGLAVYLGLWGLVQLALLAWQGIRPARPDARGLAMLLLWGLGVFALTLDRYGAAFVPTGDRLRLGLVLLVATLPLMLADQALARVIPLWQRWVARLLLVAGLVAALALDLADLGLMFVAAPVLVLFFVVYGSLAWPLRARRGDGATGIALAICLSWALAAALPTFAAAG